MSIHTHVHEHPCPRTWVSMPKTMNTCARGCRAKQTKASGKVGQGFGAVESFCTYSATGLHT